MLKFFLAILIFLSISANCDDNLKDWLQNVNDFKFDCNDFVKGLDEQDRELISVVDCNAKNAIYNYKYEAKGGKTKFKKRSQFNGFGVFELSKGSENGKFNFGLRYEKCIAIDPTFDKFLHTIAKISGHFVNDKLQGRVVVESRSGVQTVGFAHDGILLGILRNFEHRGSHDKSLMLSNVTDTEGNLLWEMDHGGNMRFNYLLDGQHKTLLTHDMKNLFDCDVVDDNLMYNCYDVEDIKSEIKNCHVHIKNKVMGKEMYHFNADIKEKFLPGKDDPFAFCKQTDKFNRHDVRKNLKEWASTVSNDTVNPFWMMNTDFEPFADGQNEVDIKLPDFKDREGYPFSREISIRNTGNLLLSGKFENGRIKEEIPLKESKSMLWRSPLRIVLKKGETQNTNGIHIDTEPGGKGIHGHTVNAKIHHGKLHGLTRIFGIYSNDKTSQCAGRMVSTGLSFIGRYENGIPTGYCWKRLLGGALIVGKVDSKGEFTGDNIAYVYPDLNTALVGTFKNGIMIKAKPAEVIGERCGANGIKILEFSEPKGPEFRYEPPTTDSFGDQPTVRDALDDKYVYQKQSLAFPVAGEGTFAKRDIAKGTIFVTYSGHRYNNQEMNMYRTKQQVRLNATENEEEKKQMQKQIHEDWKYRLSLNICGMTIDIPGKFEPTTMYQGSLGHKLNHKFLPNTRFAHFDSARFGIVMSEIAIEDIKKDDELFVSYGYGLEQAPKWYREEYKKFQKEHPDLARVKLEEKKDKDENPEQPEQMNVVVP